MVKRRSIGKTVFCIISFIAGVFIIINTTFLAVTSQNPNRLKDYLVSKVNMLINLSERTLEQIEEKINSETKSNMKEMYKSQKRDLNKRIVKLKTLLSPEVLEDNISKIIEHRYRLFPKAIFILFGIMGIISSIGLFLNKMWVRKTNLIMLLLSVLVVFSVYWESKYIAPLVLPDPSSNTVLVLLMVSVSTGLIAYNVLLYKLSNQGNSKG